MATGSRPGAVGGGAEWLFAARSALAAGAPWLPGVVGRRSTAWLQGLRATAAELAAGDGPAEVLPRIARRVADACPGGSCVVVVTLAPGTPSTSYAAGTDPQRANDVATDWIAGWPPLPGVLVAEVRAGQRTYGRIVLIGAPRSSPALRDLLAAYAGQAAAVLNRHEALEQRRWARGRATALAGLSRALLGTEDPDSVAELLAMALPLTLGCDSGGVWLWHPDPGEFRCASSAGLASAVADALQGRPVRPGEMPEAARIVTQREPLVVHAGEGSPAIEQLMQLVGVRSTVFVPLTSGAVLLGVALASWASGPLRGPVLHEALARLQGMADRASTALQNAHLVEAVRHQALHDPLTLLPNRVLFHDRLDKALTAAERTGGVAVLFCDLDQFKQINDTLGHAAGDEVLRQVASRLSDAVRPGDSVGRLSGDEFAALLPGVSDMTAAREVAQRLLECFDEPLRIEGHQLLVTASIGVSVHAGAGGLSEPLLRAADAAMYSAKRQGRSRIVLSGKGGSASASSPTLAGQLRKAVTSGQLRLLLQPIVSYAPVPQAPEVPGSDGPVGRIVGAEALVRWEHPQLGLLTPSAFVPHAEDDGSIVAVDLWMLREACREAAAWTRVGGSHHDGEQHVAVNLSLRTLTSPGLEESVRSALVDSGLPAHLLHVEVLESRALHDLPNVVERLKGLRHLGVRVVLDDFGTGFSTLTWLLRLPVDQVKVDRTFVRACAHSEELRQQQTAHAVLRGLVMLGQQLDVQVLAEGVETSEQLDIVLELGCTLVQGYLLGAPVAADELRRLVEARATVVRPAAPS